MATLLLKKMWVNLVTTGQAVSALSMPGKDEQYQAPGQVQTFAGGRRRAIVGAGEAGTLPLTLMMVARSDVDLLHQWIGQTVQVRDYKGRRFFGVFYQLDVKETPGWESVGVAQTWNLTFTLNVVTYTEAV